MNRPPSEPESHDPAPGATVPSRPSLRLVSSREDMTAFERPDDGLRRLLRVPPRPWPDEEDDDPGPSAA